LKRLILFVAALPLVASAGPPPLRVCADPNNMPFSNQARQGFENRIIEAVARQLNRSVQYVWWAQRRGYARQTLSTSACDVWPGVAAGTAAMITTQPYYRSGYVFVTRRDRPLAGLDFDDPRLRALRIGVQMIGDDGMNTPPFHALARRHITDNVRGFMVYGDYSRPNPPAMIIDAVRRGTVDVAIAWGPMAGYFAATDLPALRIQPIDVDNDGPQWPLHFAISMGVAQNNVALGAQIDAALSQIRPQIEAILLRFHIPTDPLSLQ